MIDGKFLFFFFYVLETDVDHYDHIILIYYYLRV